jgi:hypothetical protein
VIYVALLHHPVVNRQGEVIVSAVTNLDIHDIARVARTYGVSGYFVVTPLREQQALVQNLVDHWMKGPGGDLNPDRREAMQLVRIVGGLEAVQEAVKAETGTHPSLYATTAREWPGAVSWQGLRRQLRAGRGSAVLLFGTASGLDNSILESSDGVLTPIEDGREYNHLAVRSAAAIALDRLLGSRI